MVSGRDVEERPNGRRVRRTISIARPGWSEDHASVKTLRWDAQNNVCIARLEEL